MKQTEHYGLNQWELSDRVRMQDFNADNQKIDGLFGCHPSGELIAKVNVAEETEKLEIDLSQVDWSRYLALIMTLKTGTIENIFISMNSGVERSAYIAKHQEAPERTIAVAAFPNMSHLTMIVPVLYSGDHAPDVLAFGMCKETPVTIHSGFGFISGGGGEYPLNQCGKISIDRNRRVFTPGDECALWGVK